MNKKGFTLVETIVVIFIFTLLAIGVTTLFTHIFQSSRDRLFAIDNIDQARIVTRDFTNEIRVASVGEDGSYPITLAEDFQIVFNSGSPIRYYLASSTLYKEVAGKKTAVQNNVKNTTHPIFYYYNGDYSGTSTPLTSPISINQIKYVKINLEITDFNVTAGASIRNLKTNLGN